mgnify:CR=1 FL=1
MPAGLLLASTFLNLQAHEDAIRIATQVLEKDPSRVAALRIRAQALLGANKREEAIKDREPAYWIAAHGMGAFGGGQPAFVEGEEREGIRAEVRKAFEGISKK